MFSFSTDQLILVGSFLVVCLAAHRIGQALAKLKLPYISGYLAAGVLLGGSALNLIPHAAVKDLSFFQSLTLGVIAFIAGSELYLKDLRKQVKTILLITFGIITVMMILGSVLIFILTKSIPFTAGMDFHSRLAVALLGATILLALSPPSTIAVIKELKAKGQFTRTALTVTVCIDVVIVFLFAISVNIVEPLLDSKKSFDLWFLFLLLLDLVLAFGGGFLMGKLLEFALNTRFPNALKMMLIVVIGTSIFYGTKALKVYTDTHGPFEIHIEPLLTAMIAGIYITNWSAHRKVFEELLHGLSTPIYVVFFTLTGLNLELGLLIQMLPFAGMLFVMRIFGIFVGSFVGSSLAGASKSFRLMSWMAFITQAGIALGLAGEAGTHFTSLGIAFSTLIVSVILLNEIFGPLFLKDVLQRVGESNFSENAPIQTRRRAVILGIEGQSLALARQLEVQNWHVLLVDTDLVRVELLREKSGSALRTVTHIEFISENYLSKLLEESTDVFVAMLDDDADNLRACRYVSEGFSIRMIVRLNNHANTNQFRALGVFVLDPNSAMVNLMEQAIRAPQSAALILHQDEARQLEQIRILNQNMDGVLVRDLRLPADVLLLDVVRKGEIIVPNGFTRLQIEDEVTVIGSAEDLDTVKLRLSA